MNKKLIKVFVLGITVFASLALPSSVLAQDEPQSLFVTTDFPSRVAEIGEPVNINIEIQAAGSDQTVALDMKSLPEGWDAIFRGGGQVVKAAFVEQDTSISVSLMLTSPEDVQPGDYTFAVSGKSAVAEDDLEITLSLSEKVPASMTLTTELPTITGSPDTTFRYNTTLTNNSDEDLNINISADAPSDFLPKFSLSGQEVTSFPIEANRSKSITVEFEPIGDIDAGEYPITIYANGGDLQAQLALTMVVTGEQNLVVTGVDGLLSGDATAGEATTIQVMVENKGTAPAQGVTLSSSAPTGWKISFTPENITEIPAGGNAEVTASMTPPDKAIAGDYMVTIRAKPVQGSTKSADFRITVKTSTLWGIAGLGLIAVAVAVVGIAVVRFGRR